MKQRMWPIVLISFLLGVIFDWFFHGKIPGISVFLYAALILGFTLFLTRQYKKPLNPSVYWLASVIAFFSLMVFVRANLFLAFINILIVLYLLMLVARLAHMPALQLKQFAIVQYFYQLVSIPINAVREFLRALQRAANNRNTTGAIASYAPILRGLIFSLPILIVFLILLSSADLVFKGILTSLFDVSVAPETVFRWGLVGFVASVFIGAYAFVFMPASKPKFDSKSNGKKFDLGATESSIVLGSVGMLFLAFVVIQLAYLFGGASQIASTGYSFAEYARKGFFELIAVAAISLLLILLIKSFTVHSTPLQKRLFKWLSGALIVEVMVIMLSAHMRLNLYEDAYGFTTLRLFSHLFMVWLASAFALLLFHIIKEQNEKIFALHLFISVLSFFALINLVNPDGFIAEKNIERFNQVGKLDLHYLSGLSEDATPAVAKLLDHPDAAVQRSAAGILYQQKHYTDNEYADSWLSTNLGRQRANQIFKANAAEIEAGKSYGELRELNSN